MFLLPREYLTISVYCQQTPRKLKDLASTRIFLRSGHYQFGPLWLLAAFQRLRQSQAGHQQGCPLSPICLLRKRPTANISLAAPQASMW